MTNPNPALAAGWIGVDYDGTLAVYKGWGGPSWETPPVPAMVERVKGWLAAGKPVRIFTSRVYPLNRCVMPDDVRELHGTHLDNVREDECWTSIETIRRFCVRHFNVVLPITNVKDFRMITLWDDRCEQVEANTGRRAVDVAWAMGFSKQETGK